MNSLTRRTLLSLIIIALVAGLPLSAQAAIPQPWVLLDDPPGDVALGAILRAAPPNRRKIASVKKKQNPFWVANGRITVSPKDPDRGTFKGTVAGHRATNQPVQRLAAVSIETRAVVLALQGIVDTGGAVVASPRRVLAKMDAAQTALESAIGTINDSGLSSELKEVIVGNLETSLAELAEAREFAAANNPLRGNQQKGRALSMLGDAAFPIQDCVRIILANL